MIPMGEWANPTRLVGVSVYLTGTICCVVASQRNQVSSRLSQKLAAVEGILLLDILFDWRWKLHDFLQQLAVRDNLYEGRRDWQIVALIGLLMAFCALAWWTLRSLRGRPGALLAVNGALLSVVCWCSEVVSLHDVDVEYYRLHGPFMMVSLFWVFGALMTSFGVLSDARQLRGAQTL